MKRFAVCAALLAVLPAAAAASPGTSKATGSRTVFLPARAIAYFPASVPPETAAAPPILIILHGGAQGPGEYISLFSKEADRRGIVLLAPSSKGVTWDVVADAVVPGLRGRSTAHDIVYRGSPDGDRVEAAIGELAKYVPIDRSRLVLAGMSDGGTFALALGMLRTHDFAGVIAFSPGIPSQSVPPAIKRRVWVAHGREDEVLSFATTCRMILPALRREGAQVSFRAFDGEHEISPEVANEFLNAAFAAASNASALAADERSACG